MTFLGYMWGVMEMFDVRQRVEERSKRHNHHHAPVRHPPAKVLPEKYAVISYHLLFAFANGPLGWSVILLQNRLGAYFVPGNAEERSGHADPSTWIPSGCSLSQR